MLTHLGNSVSAGDIKQGHATSCSITLGKFHVTTNLVIFSLIALEGAASSCDKVPLPFI